MVRDGYLYALPLITVAALLAWLTSPAWAIIPVLLAVFFLWFFRDPERVIPDDAGAVVSPGDGKVTDVVPVTVGGKKLLRISIFLSVFDVHVNRSPIGGTITDVRYQRGRFLDARNKLSAEQNKKRSDGDQRRDQEQRRVHRIPRHDGQQTRQNRSDGEDPEENRFPAG